MVLSGVVKQVSPASHNYRIKLKGTGGGWGGAVVSLVPMSKTEDFLEKVKRMYPLYKGLSEEEVDEAAFATLPGSGAGGE